MSYAPYHSKGDCPIAKARHVKTGELVQLSLDANCRGQPACIVHHLLRHAKQRHFQFCKALWHVTSGVMMTLEHLLQISHSIFVSMPFIIQ